MIDANEIGRLGYQFFRETAVVPDKDIKELTFKDKVELVRELKTKLQESAKYVASDRQEMFNAFILSAVIAYINSCDINLFIQINEKNVE